MTTQRRKFTADFIPVLPVFTTVSRTLPALHSPPVLLRDVSRSLQPVPFFCGNLSRSLAGLNLRSQLF